MAEQRLEPAALKPTVPVASAGRPVALSSTVPPWAVAAGNDEASNDVAALITVAPSSALAGLASSDETVTASVSADPAGAATVTGMVRVAGLPPGRRPAGSPQVTI